MGPTLKRKGKGEASTESDPPLAGAGSYQAVAPYQRGGFRFAGGARFLVLVTETGSRF